MTYIKPVQTGTETDAGEGGLDAARKQRQNAGGYFLNPPRCLLAPGCQGTFSRGEVMAIPHSFVPVIILLLSTR